MNKKGFTLIELLAVIVILAIILLIAMPIVIGVIEEAREGAFQSTGHGLWKATELEYNREILGGGAVVERWYAFEAGTQTVYIETGTPGTYTATGAPDALEYTGGTPENGVIQLGDDGAIEFWLHDGTFCAYKTTASDEVVTSKEDLATCAARAAVALTVFP